MQELANGEFDNKTVDLVAQVVDTVGPFEQTWHENTSILLADLLAGELQRL